MLYLLKKYILIILKLLWTIVKTKKKHPIYL